MVAPRKYPEELRERAIRVVRPGGWVFAAGFPGGHVHLADDLEQEALDAGLRDVRTVGLEGPGALALEVSRSHDPHLIAAARPWQRPTSHNPGCVT